MSSGADLAWLTGWRTMGLYRTITEIGDLLGKVFLPSEERRMRRDIYKKIRKIKWKRWAGKLSEEEWNESRDDVWKDIRQYTRVMLEEGDRKRLEWERQQPTISVIICSSGSQDYLQPVGEQLIVAVTPRFSGHSFSRFQAGRAGFATSIEESPFFGDQSRSAERNTVHLEIQRGRDRWEGSSLEFRECETEDPARRTGSGKTALAAKLRLSAALYDHLVGVIQPLAPPSELPSNEQDNLIVFSIRCQPFEFPVERDVVPNQPIPDAFRRKLQTAVMYVAVAMEEARLEQLGEARELGQLIHFVRPGYSERRRYVEIGRWRVTETRAAQATDPNST